MQHRLDAHSLYYIATDGMDADSDWVGRAESFKAGVEGLGGKPMAGLWIQADGIEDVKFRQMQNFFVCQKLN
ncbi:hypothetical protein [Labrys miyagiensis]|uniref:hypothetical protein n=1 Tax=Labrys miyagiensis TaxID=346912 RepID=UPI0024E14621|nr:hypothetical protein [Labrys miyagiensis]